MSELQGSRVLSSRFRVRGSGFKVQGSGFRVQGSRFRVQGSRFRVQGSGFKGYNRCILLPILIKSGIPVIRHPRSIVCDLSSRYAPCAMLSASSFVIHPPPSAFRLQISASSRRSAAKNATKNKGQICLLASLRRCVRHGLFTTSAF
jgi:hypothetical protein